MKDFIPLPPKKTFPQKRMDLAILFRGKNFSRKGRETCLSQLVVRVIRNSGGNSESNRSATAAKGEASEGEEERKGSEEQGGSGRTVAYRTLPPPGGNHMLPGFMSTPTSERGRPTGKASPPPSSYPNKQLALLSPRVFLPSRFPPSLAGVRMLDPFVSPDYGDAAIRLAMFKAIFEPTLLQGSVHR